MIFVYGSGNVALGALAEHFDMAQSLKHIGRVHAAGP